MKPSDETILIAERTPRLTLKRRPNEEERAQHPWVFSNEIQDMPKKFERFEAGTVVEVLNCHGEYLGHGIWHPQSLISVRILSRSRGEAIDTDFFQRRISRAVELRHRLLGQPTKNTFRAVHGEADELPGLVVDRYQGAWVLQFHSLGMYQRREEIIAAIQATELALGLEPQASFVIRTDVQSRGLEGLPEVREWRDERKNKLPVFAHEGGINFPVDPEHGQKTGFFFDQRCNRDLLAAWIASDAQSGRELRVLDLFCNSGGWGLRALAAGAHSAVFLDSSESAIASAQKAAADFGVSARSHWLVEDYKSALGKMPEASFDYVVVDPPSFIPSKKDLVEGLRSYQRLNAQAIRLVKKGGVVITASCSHHCLPERFESTIQAAFRAAKRSASLIHRGGASPDHPERPGMPESRYLKCLFYRVW